MQQTTTARDVARVTERRVVDPPGSCPVCDGRLRALRARWWECQRGHTVIHWPELLEAAGRFKLGWADDLSGDLELSAAEGGSGREGLEGRPVTVEIPVASSEQIAEAKAEWERKHKRERQRRWRARKRAGLV